MKRHLILIMLTMHCMIIFGLKTQVNAIKHAKMNLLILTAAQANQEVHDVVSVLQRDFSFSGQFNVIVQKNEGSLNKQIKNAAKQGFPLIVYIASSAQENAINWRLYNALLGSLIKGGKYIKNGTVSRGWAHAIADIIWPEITSQPGFFSSKIVYCKQIDRGEKQDYKHIYIADFDGSHEQLLVGTPTINVGPRFNKDLNQCLIFYSQFTRQNVEMRVADMHKRQRTVSTLDGVTMLPAFSDDGKRVVYCASNGSGSCQIYLFEDKKLIKITDNEYNNVSPVFAHNGTAIYFCSDMSGRPSIYCCDIASNAFELVTQDGVCMSPAYCAQNNRLAYCKKINGYYQLCTYDCVQKKHMQLTYNDGHKSECSWSPCGNYVVYAVEKGDAYYLETINTLNNSTQRLAVVGRCSYPNWSLCYKEYPVIS